MSPARRFKNMFFVSGMVVTICVAGISACREEQPVQPPSSAVESSADNSAEKSEHGDSRTQPGVEISTTTDEDKQEKQKDAPDSPIAFPQSEDLENLAKVEPIRTAAPGKADKLIDEPDTVRILQSFHIQKLATCVYQHVEGRARVLFVEAQHPEDAFGLFSLLAPQQWKFASDWSIRAEKVENHESTLYGWQGRCFARVHVSGPLSKKEDGSTERLLDHLLFFEPGADAPILVRILPREKLSQARIWVVRNLNTLSLAGIKPLSEFEPAQLDERLHLNDQALATVAALEVPENENANVIFLVRYPTPRKARQAYQRYREAMEMNPLPLDRETIPFEPKGCFFMGSWTAGQESIQGMLNQLRQALPE